MGTGGRSGARRRAGAACVALALLPGCRVTLDVGIESRAAGGGTVAATVTLDRAAVAEIGDLRAELRVDDLRRAGWEVVGPVAAAKGGVRIKATKRFTTAGEAARVVEELGGRDGPFRDFRLTQRRSLLKVRSAVTGTVDLRQGIEAFSDPILRNRVGSPLGFDPAALERHSGTALVEGLRVSVAAHLPGDERGEGARRRSGGAVWEPRLGEVVHLRASAEQWNLRTLGGAAVTAVGLLGVLWVLVRRRAGSRR